MSPLRTAVMDDHEVDAAGVSSVLSRFGDRVSLVDPDSAAGAPDVILYGLRERHAWHDADLHLLLRDQPGTVIVLDWGTDAPQVEWALSCGAHGRLSKTLTAAEIVTGVEQIHRSRELGRPVPLADYCHPALLDVALTPRELGVLTLITQGYTNQEIADQVFISINSVKTYVRTAYRKIGVARRAQAVSWGVQHGLDVMRGDGTDVVPIA